MNRRRIIPMELVALLPVIEMEVESVAAEVVAVIPEVEIEIETIPMELEAEDIVALVQLSYRENDSAIAGLAIAGLAIAGNF